MTDLVTIVAEPWDDWGLIDCGDGQKLERYGPYKVVRPEPQAMWAPARDDWDPDATFVPGSDEEGGGRWVQHRPVPRRWGLERDGAKFNASLTPFRHLGFFPDMAPQWDWMRSRADGAEVLNLFGYTGVGTLLLSEAGAKLVHVDASKKSVEQGRENAVLSGLDERPIRWLVDDASKFTAREVRRGRRYDGILLDPPKFGRGPDGEVWRLEENLVAAARRLPAADGRRQPVPGAHGLCGADVGDRHRRAGQAAVRRPWRDGRDGRNGGARGSARAAPADGDFREVV